MQKLLPYLKFAPLHLLFWVFVWLFYVYFFSYASSSTAFVFWFSSSLLPITIAATYIFAYLLIPNYLLTKKYIAFSLYGVATVITSVYIILLVNFIIFIFLVGYQIDDMPLLTRNIFFIVVLVYLVVGLVCFVKVIEHTYSTGSRNKLLENKMLETQLQIKEKELYYLKQQIHPHFLFNTLNTIYGFALIESKDTPALILKLSAMLDYMLYQIDKKQVHISEEIKYIESYIGLEQVRFRETLKVTFQKDITAEVFVPPMLFMAFIENAFKHGAIVDGLMEVIISLKGDSDMLELKVKNTIKENRKEIDGHGIGLENTRKRLEANYQSNYTLKIVENEKWYSTRLQIDLKNHPCLKP